MKYNIADHSNNFMECYSVYDIKNDIHLWNNQ